MVNLKNAYTLYRRKCLLRWVAKNIGQKQVFILDAQELETLFILKMHLHCCQISDCRAYNVATLHWDYLIALLPAAATTDAPGRDQCSLWEQKTLSKMGAWVGNVECGNVQRVARTTDRQLCGRGWAGGLQAYNFYYNKGVVDVRIQMRICRVALCPVFFLMNMQSVGGVVDSDCLFATSLATLPQGPKSRCMQLLPLLLPSNCSVWLRECVSLYKCTIRIRICIHLTQNVPFFSCCASHASFVFYQLVWK